MRNVARSCIDVGHFDIQEMTSYRLAMATILSLAVPVATLFVQEGYADSANPAVHPSCCAGYRWSIASNLLGRANKEPVSLVTCVCFSSRRPIILQGSDRLLGDHGLFDVRLLATQQFVSIYTNALSTASNDTIYGGNKLI
jgi:hypothetical protein